MKAAGNVGARHVADRLRVVPDAVHAERLPHVAVEVYSHDIYSSTTVRYGQASILAGELLSEDLKKGLQTFEEMPDALGVQAPKDRAYFSTRLMKERSARDCLRRSKVVK